MEIDEMQMVRMLQTGEAIIDMRTKEVYALEENELRPSEIRYLGVLRRKAIPNRKKLEVEPRAQSTQVRFEQEFIDIFKAKIKSRGEQSIRYVLNFF